MKRQFYSQHKVSRSGMTRIEVFLILIPVLLLLSLFLLPFIQRADRTSRRLECANNIRTLGMATITHASSQAGKVPLVSQPAPAMASGKNAIWLLHLLPYLDRADTIEYITQQQTAKSAESAVHAVLKGTYRFLECPLDPNRLRQPGGISYGANIGYGAWRGTSQGVATAYDFGETDHCAVSIDWNGNGKLDPIDKDVARSTGVFWSADEDGFRMTLDDIMNGDGTGQTILFAETMNLPLMHLAGSAKDGLNPRALDAGIGLGYEALGLKTGTKPNLCLDRAAKPTSEYQQCFAPNTNLGTAAGKWPAVSSPHKYPNSAWSHGGYVNVIFADGHVSAVSYDINWAVWASLHTPRGRQHGEAEISDTDF